MKHRTGWGQPVWAQDKLYDEINESLEASILICRVDGLKGLLWSKGGAGQKASQQPQFVSFSPAILGQSFQCYNLEVFANQRGETTAIRAADSPLFPGQHDLQKPPKQIFFKWLEGHEPGLWTTDLMFITTLTTFLASLNMAGEHSPPLVIIGCTMSSATGVQKSDCSKKTEIGWINTDVLLDRGITNEMSSGQFIARK